MSLLNQLRKNLGPLKCKLLDEWPYRGKVRSIPGMRARFKPLLAKLAPLPPFKENIYEIHMLCGTRDADMGIWASWSIMRFLNGCSRLYVHSDGTLTSEDEAAWRKIIGEVIVIRREQSDAKAGEMLGAETKHLYHWRNTNWASIQLVDAHLFGDAPNLLIMDSDVLTFSKPDEVIKALTSRSPKVVWCRDLLNAYSASPEILREVTGVTVVERLCAGFLVTPRFKIADFLEIDRHMSAIDKDPRTEVNHFWSCQTYYALIAAGYPDSGELPEQYSNIASKTPASQVLRHFVGVPRVRFRYFTEGLPKLAKAGPSPNNRP